MSSAVNQLGYRQVNLRTPSGRRTYHVHRLVAETFHGKPPAGLVCRHLDGNPTNNRAENLKWGTYKQNQDDSLRHGTRAMGERNGHAKLTAEQVLRIRKLAPSTTAEKRALADSYGVSEATIYDILKRKSWRHL